MIVDVEKCSSVYNVAVMTRNLLLTFLTVSAIAHEDIEFLLVRCRICGGNRWFGSFATDVGRRCSHIGVP